MAPLPIFLFCGILLIVQPSFGRDRGWVPLEQNTIESLDLPKTNVVKLPKTQGKTHAKVRPVEKTELTKRGPNLTVYEDQPPVTEKELNLFLVLMPQFRQWAREHHEDAHPVVNELGKPDFKYSPQAAAWVQTHNFEPSRFFCIMGKMAAGMVMAAEGPDYKTPKDMPDLKPKELELARKHLGELLTVSGAAK